MTQFIFIVIFILLIFCVIKLSKDSGKANAITDLNKKEKEQYEKDKEVINANNNLTHNELIDKLHDIQKKR